MRGVETLVLSRRTAFFVFSSVRTLGLYLERLSHVLGDRMCDDLSAYSRALTAHSVCASRLSQSCLCIIM